MERFKRKQPGYQAKQLTGEELPVPPIKRRRGGRATSANSQASNATTSQQPGARTGSAASEISPADSVPVSLAEPAAPSAAPILPPGPTSRAAAFVQASLGRDIGPNDLHRELYLTLVVLG